MRLTVPFGTRPEIVKLAPVVRELRHRGWPTRLVFTGQHFDPALGEEFLRSLDMEPDTRWTLPSDPAAALGALLERAVEEVTAFATDAVLLMGDTMTVPVFCLAARRACVPVVHLEAGLRSFNETSMEEVNRRIAAATASLHLAPTALAARFLGSEGVDTSRIRVVGNTVVDVVRESGVSRLPVESRAGVLVTAHRASTVDSPERLQTLVDLLVRIAALAASDTTFGPVIFPAHPRTRDRLTAADLLSTLTDADINVVPPLPYREMLTTLASSRVVVTDSGGLQEEAAWFGVPVVVLRRSTPRWEGVAAGSSELVGLNGDAALAAVARFGSVAELKRVDALECPYGDGFAAARAADAVAEAWDTGLLSFREPDFVGRAVPAVEIGGGGGAGGANAGGAGAGGAGKAGAGEIGAGGAGGPAGAGEIGAGGGWADVARVGEVGAGRAGAGAGGAGLGGAGKAGAGEIGAGGAGGLAGAGEIGTDRAGASVTCAAGPGEAGAGRTVASEARTGGSRAGNAGAGGDARAGASDIGTGRAGAGSTSAGEAGDGRGDVEVPWR